jgi:hypothetical protein
MKDIKEFARKPELIRIELDAEDVVAEFGDTVVFYMKDYVDVSTYFDFYRSQTDNPGGLNSVLKKLVLNAEGQPVMGDDQALPATLAIGALSKISEHLGKSRTKSLMSETGNPPV